MKTLSRVIHMALLGCLLLTSAAFAEQQEGPPLTKPTHDFPPLEEGSEPISNIVSNNVYREGSFDPTPHEGTPPSVASTNQAMIPTFSTQQSTGPIGPPVKMKTVYYSVPGILVLPIIPPASQHAFHDSAVMIANSMAEGLEKKFPDTYIYQPFYTLKNLHQQGLGKAYQQLSEQYYQAGRPSPMLLQYIIDHIQPKGSSADISRVVFVQSNVNMNQPDKSHHIIDIFNRFIKDAPSNTPRYHINSRIKVYNNAAAHLDLIWQGQWSEPVKTNQFAQVSISVFDSPDSHVSFQKASNRISTVFMLRSPKPAFMRPNEEPITATQVKANRRP